MAGQKIVKPSYRFSSQINLLLVSPVPCGWKESIMNDKVLIIAIFGILGVGFISVLFIAVPWLINYALPNWRESLLDSGIVIVAVCLFVYGFYMNVKMH